MSVTAVNQDNFEKEVLESSIPVLVDFWASWCQPCKMLAPVVEGVAGEMDGKVKFCKLNVDENPQLAALYRVMSIPTLVIFEAGKEIKRSVGFVSAEEIKSLFVK